MKKTSLTMPMTAARAAIHKHMTPATKEVAAAGIECHRDAAIGTVLPFYDLGVKLAEIQKSLKDSNNYYGENALSQLAVYWGYAEDENDANNVRSGVTKLYQLGQFASTFSRDFVEEFSKQPNSKGKCATLSTWLELAKIEDASVREECMSRFLRDAISVQDMKDERLSGGSSRNKRSGGRHIAKPSSPTVGLLRLSKMAATMTKYVETVLTDAVVSPIEEADDVSSNILEQLANAHDQLNTLSAALEQAEADLTKLEATVKKRADKAEDKKAEGKKPAVKPGKKPTGKADKKRTKVKV